jgi:asparagine synthase (glutamine-hydrolysing)
MCGIYGEVIPSGVDRRALRADAVDVLSHRGPDDRGVWIGDDVVLAMRRLSIIDLEGGRQPMWNEDGRFCLVFNGELYNYKELRPPLESLGHVFRTRSDTEVVLHAYEQWGPKCLDRFNGMFAFAIWDRSERVLFLARDRIGEKPLYYYWDGQRFIFASEIKAILADRTIPRDLNPAALSNYLAFGHGVAPETIYQHISKVMPGHYLVLRGGSLHHHEYWDVGDHFAQAKDDERPSEGEFEERILTLLSDSVHRRMVADVPIGAFLSGGVDSAAVVALAQRGSSEPIKTFSLGFSVGGAYDELPDARAVAEALGTDHHELIATDADLVATLEALVYHYDEPFGDPAGFPTYLLSRLARQHVKVVLTGDGGDELFGGYRRYLAERYAPAFRRVPAFVRDDVLPAIVGRLPRLRRVKRTVRTLAIEDAAERYASWLMLFSPELQRELVPSSVWGSLNEHDVVAPYRRYFARADRLARGDRINAVMYADLKTLLADAYMEKVDKATMACSLEARLPLLDHRLVELAFEIPSAMKVRRSSSKRVLKRALRHIVPAFVLARAKHGFEVPLDVWFRGSLKSYAFEVLLDSSTQRTGFVNRPVVERLWREHRIGRNVWDEHLWLILNLELWGRMFLGEGGASTRARPAPIPTRVSLPEN